MQQRTSAWRLEGEGILTAQPRSQQVSRKRKHTSPPDKANIDTELSRTKKAWGNSLEHEINSINRGTSPQTANLSTRSNPRRCDDYLRGEPFPVHVHTDHAIRFPSLPSRYHCGVEGTNIIYDEDTLLMSQAFNAAYEAILPETCSLLGTGA
ncbi:hypothetical protein BDV10DRAFT_112057 [Aspergillus recurvatus]